MSKSPTLVFVYGTLKRGFGNHHVLGSSTLVGNATTVNSFPLFVDCYRVPYLVDKPSAPTSHCIAGELYEVPPDELVKLDILEGIAEERYIRRLVPINHSPSLPEYPPVSEAWCYLLPERPGLDLEHRDLLGEYSLEVHAGFVPPGDTRDSTRRQAWGGYE